MAAGLGAAGSAGRGGPARAARAGVGAGIGVSAAVLRVPWAAAASTATVLGVATVYWWSAWILAAIVPAAVVTMGYAVLGRNRPVVGIVAPIFTSIAALVRQSLPAADARGGHSGVRKPNAPGRSAGAQSCGPVASLPACRSNLRIRSSARVSAAMAAKALTSMTHQPIVSAMDPWWNAYGVSTAVTTVSTPRAASQTSLNVTSSRHRTWQLPTREGQSVRISQADTAGRLVRYPA